MGIFQKALSSSPADASESRTHANAGRPGPGLPMHSLRNAIRCHRLPPTAITRECGLRATLGGLVTAAVVSDGHDRTARRPHTNTQPASVRDLSDAVAPALLAVATQMFGSWWW